MSMKGVQNIEENGGAHQPPHETFLQPKHEVNFDIVKTKSDLNEHSSDNGQERLGATFQDGVVSFALSSTDFDNLSTDITGQPRSLLQLGTQLGLAAGSNDAEWLKSKLKSPGFILGSSKGVVWDGDEVAKKTVESKRTAGAGDNTVFILPVQQGIGAKSDTMPNGGISLLQGAISDQKSKLSSQDRACLEELERGSQLSQEEKELLENSCKELSALEFHGLDQDEKNGSVLIASSDLEDRDLVFGDGVSTSGQIGRQTSTEQLDAISSLSTVTDHLPTHILTSSELQSVISNNSLLSSSSTSDYSTTLAIPEGENNAGQIQEAGDWDNRISISADRNTNTTQIVVNMPQGNQVFQINTDDLSTQDVLSSQSGLTTQGAVGNGNLSSGLNAQQCTTAPKITIQDGYLVIPVNSADSQQESIILQPLGDFGKENQQSGPTPVCITSFNLIPVTVNDSGEKSYPCKEKGCNKVFTKPSKLKIHMMSHSGERPFKCNVPGCEWAFTTKHKLTRHQEIHSEREVFPCEVPDCGRKFTTIYNLQTHLKQHVRPATIPCRAEGCGKMFVTQRLLDLHVGRMHKDLEKTYKCPVEGCTKTFLSAQSMGSHARVHQEGQDLVCKFPGCGKQFDKRCRFMVHTRSHTGEKPFHCEEEGCGWSFATASKLKRHMRKHTGERKYICPHEDCKRAFMRSEHLKGHLITHSGEKPFVCPIEDCKTRFTAKSSLYVHMKNHRMRGNLPLTFYCPFDGCDRRYSNKASFKTHLSKHYQDMLGNGQLPLSHQELNESLEALATHNVQEETATATIIASAAAASMIPTDDTTINPSDLINSQPGDQPSVVTLSPGTGSLELGISGTTQLDAATTTDLLQYASQVAIGSTLGAEDTSIITLRPGVKTSPSHEGSTGSARTDYTSNLILSDRAKKRRKLLKESAITITNFSSIEEDDLCKTSRVSNTSLNEALCTTSATATSGTSVTASFSTTTDLLPSQGITFRDPDTGAIYVQTQLLQDDPPHPDLYSEDHQMDTCDSSGLDADLTATILAEAEVADAGDDFSGTTINLQDLA